MQHPIASANASPVSLQRTTRRPGERGRLTGRQAGAVGADFVAEASRRLQRYKYEGDVVGRLTGGARHAKARAARPASSGCRGRPCELGRLTGGARQRRSGEAGKLRVAGVVRMNWGG